LEDVSNLHFIRNKVKKDKTNPIDYFYTI